MRALLPLLISLLLASLAPAQAVRTIPSRSVADARHYRRILRTLDHSRLSVDWRERSLKDAVRELQRSLGLNFVIAPEIRPRAEEAVLDLSLREVTGTTLVKILAEQTSVVFQHRHGVIFVTTEEDALKRSLVLHLHDVSELLYTPPDFPAPDIGIRIGSPEDQPEEVERESKDPELLLDIIRQSTGPASWELEGVTLALSRRTLVIRHTPEMQLKVRRLLSRLHGVF